VNILAGELGQAVDLLFESRIKARIRVSEIYGRIYHLQIQKFHALFIIEIRALTAHKYVGILHIMNGVAP
jgi:hypothetical protein